MATYKNQTIIKVDGINIHDGYRDQVYFKDGARSRLVTDGKWLVDAVAEKGYYENYQHMLMWDKSDMVALTKANVAEFIGKRIYFFSKQYRANPNAEGIATIDAVDFGKRTPLSCTHESGYMNYLEYAFLNDDDEFCIGDEDRPAMVKVL